jgi:hypothetical protein
MNIRSQFKIPFLILFLFALSYNLYSLPQQCKCGKWIKPFVTVDWIGLDGKPQQDSAKCGNTKPVAVQYYCKGTLITGSFGKFDCSPSNCIAQYMWSIVGPSGFHVSSGASAALIFNYSFMPSVMGTYTLTIVPYCGKLRCTPCIIKINVMKMVECCNCGEWKEQVVNVKWNDLKPQEVKVKCGDKAVIASICGGTSVNLNFSEFICVPKPCVPKYVWSVAGPSGFTGTSGTNPFNNTIISFKPTVIGFYTITITPECGGKRCKPCVIKLEVKKITKCVPTKTEK